MLLADWINLSEPAATALLVISTLVEAFWPLTAVAAIAVLIWWRRRSSIGRRIAAIVAILLWAVSAATYVRYVGGEALNSAEIRSRQETLHDARDVAGVRLPAGTLVQYADGARTEIQTIDLPRETLVDGMPLRGSVNFSNGRPDGFVTLAQDATIDGVPCSAASDVHLTEARLDTCTLSRASIVRGVPCKGEVTLSADGSTQCTLSSPYRRFGVTWAAGTGIYAAANGGSFDITAQPPNLYVLGTPLPHRADVSYAAGRLDGINFSNGILHYRGCDVMFVTVAYNGESAKAKPDRCGLPRDRDGSVVLPPSAFSVR